MLKNLDYLNMMVEETGLTEKDLPTVLEYIGYVLADNDCIDGRLLLEEIIDTLED